MSSEDNRQGIDEQVPPDTNDEQQHLVNENEPEREETEDERRHRIEDEKMAELRARVTSSQGTRKRDSNIGGLIDETGMDLRQQTEDLDTRRRGKWRGLERAGVAGLQYDYALETFDYKIQASILGSDLRIYIVFVIWFCFFFLIGRDINQNHYFAAAVRDPVLGSEIAQLKVEKFFTDISEAREWNLWVLDVFLFQTIDLE